jgi:hypothetical protein
MRTGRLAVFAIIIGSVPSLTLVAFAQTSADGTVSAVEVCEVVQNPTAYDKQLIRFRGRLEFEFEGDNVDDHDCGVKLLHTGIWWTYGGDPLFALSHQTDRIKHLVSPILRDASFQTFNEHVRLRRLILPDGKHCRSQRDCAYYDVVATFSGRFFSGHQQPQRRGLGGYGHMGCCHLFVIEQISDVTAQRTPIPPDDQVFSCTSISWQSEYPATAVSSFDERVNINRQFLMDQARSRCDALLADKINTDPLWQFTGLTGTLSCSSPDLLTTYTATFPQPYLNLRKKHHQQAEPPSPVPPVMNLSRERCEPVAN